MIRHPLRHFWPSLYSVMTLALLLLIGGIILAHLSYKKDHHGELSYGKGLLIGTILSLVAAIVTVDDDAEDVAHARLGCCRDLAVGHPSRQALGFGVADSQEELVAPALELAGVAQPAPPAAPGLTGRFRA